VVGLDVVGAAPDPFYRDLGVPYTRLVCRHDLDATLPPRLARVVRGADLLHTHLVHADVYGALVPGVAIVATKHNPDPFRAGPFRFVERALTRRARRLIAISEAVHRFNVERIGLPADKVDVVHYGLDELPKPWAENPELPIAADARVLLCVGRLAQQKGVDTAIRALAAVREHHPKTVLLVLGEGPARKRLEALARELDVGDSVHMPGRLGDVTALYRRADLLVHPVRWEGFGLALLEAMLAAKPVVASAVSAAPEIVVDGVTGLLVPPDRPDTLAEAVSSLLDDPARADALGRTGLGRARAEFSVAKMAERTLEVYDRVLSEAGRRPFRSPSSLAR
jgi:glycosyltransferase involved in cell wall biosynthesis